MKAVRYFSKLGNTKTIAEVIFGDWGRARNISKIFSGSLLKSSAFGI